MVFVWEVKIAKLGEKEPFESLNFIGGNFFEISHVIAEYVFENDMYDFPVEVLNISKVVNVGKIVNGDIYEDFNNDEHEIDPDIPYQVAKNFPKDKLISFKCVCKEKIEVAPIPWGFIWCKNCGQRILRSDVSDVGGIVIYECSNPDEKRK